MMIADGLSKATSEEHSEGNVGFSILAKEKECKVVIKPATSWLKVIYSTSWAVTSPG